METTRVLEKQFLEMLQNLRTQLFGFLLYLLLFESKASVALSFFQFQINSSVRTGSREKINRYLGMPLVGSSPSHEFLLSNKNTVDLALTNEGGGEWHLALAMVGRTVIYAVIMALLLGLVALVAKLLASCEEEQLATPRERTASETSRLLAKEADSDNYGTCTEEEENIEVGKCSSSNGSSEDLYDGKICVICYDEQRNCFFIPCGHCATCYVCARRIKDEESKTCPVCRRYIRKIKKLFV